LLATVNDNPQATVRHHHLGIHSTRRHAIIGKKNGGLTALIALTSLIFTSPAARKNLTMMNGRTGLCSPRERERQKNVHLAFLFYCFR
jgi:hypothetical protein